MGRKPIARCARAVHDRRLLALVDETFVGHSEARQCIVHGFDEGIGAADVEILSQVADLPLEIGLVDVPVLLPRRWSTRKGEMRPVL